MRSFAPDSGFAFQRILDGICKGSYFLCHIAQIHLRTNT